MSTNSVSKFKKTLKKYYISLKLHYFLRLSGIAPIIFLLPLILRQKNISGRIVGVLWAITRFIGLLCALLAGVISDVFRIHRYILLSAVLTISTGILSLYYIPPVVNNISEDVHVLQNYFSNSSQPKDLRNDTISYNDHHSLRETDDELNLSDYLSNVCFWLIVGCILIEQVGTMVAVTFEDVICFKILNDKPHKYGSQRVCGTLGVGSFALITGAAIDHWSIGKESTDYTPAYIICGVLMLLDLIAILTMTLPQTSDTSTKVNISSVGNIITDPQTLIFLITSVLSGLVIGATWTFKIMLVEDISLAWNPEFSSLKLLQGLLISCETFGGEMPFFFLAGRIIEKLGSRIVFVISLTAQAVRCIGLYCISNPWYFLTLEVLNGPAYGLFHTNMVAHANYIAPVDLQATLQAIVRSCFVVGTCSGNFIGGLLYHSYGASLMFLYLGLGMVLYIIIYILLQVIIAKCATGDRRKGNRKQYHIPNNSVQKRIRTLSLQQMGASQSSSTAAI